MRIFYMVTEIFPFVKGKSLFTGEKIVKSDRKVHKSLDFQVKFLYTE